jgi:hypothetical protein
VVSLKRRTSSQKIQIHYFEKEMYNDIDMIEKKEKKKKRNILENTRLKIKFIP